MTGGVDANAALLYFDLMKQCLTYSIWGEPMHPVEAADIGSRWKRMLFPFIVDWLATREVFLVRDPHFDPAVRAEGRDHPLLGHTMIGLRRLDNLQFCIQDVLENNVPGDLIETGVWRGGATIFMRAVLKGCGVTDRTIWVADSFEGLPRPNPALYPADFGDTHHTMPHLAVSLEEVKENFAKYNLLDSQVRFLKGWFRDTLPAAPIETLAVMRLDGDMYESTMQALTHLYPKLSVGGYVIIDDYGYTESCRRAVNDFRHDGGIDDALRAIDRDGVYWQRSR